MIVDERDALSPGCESPLVAPPPTTKPLPLDPDVLTRELAELGELSMRQQEVIRLTLMGQTLVQIGIRLGVSPRTAKMHRLSAFERLGVSSTSELWTLIFEYGGHSLRPLDKFPIDWAQVCATLSASVTVDRVVRMTGRSPREVERALRRHGFELDPPQ